MYACHRFSQAAHKKIARYFGLTRRGGISSSLSRMPKEVSDNQWEEELELLEKALFIVE